MLVRSDFIKEDLHLFHYYLKYFPHYIYLYKNLLKYNLVKGSKFYNIAVCDIITLNCVLISGDIIKAIFKRFNTKFRGYDYYIFKICFTLSWKLKYSNITNKTLFSIIILIINKVSFNFL